MSEAYEEFASVYDELMDTVPYEKWCERIVRMIDEYGISERVRGSGSSEDTLGLPKEETEPTREELLESERNLVVDLGCGTGTMTEMLYSEGFDMIGIDNSGEMLEMALEKRDETGSEILYLNQNMLELELFSTVGTVVSVCDSVNYLTEDGDFEALAGLIHNYLYPGGLFIFDFNTVHKYRDIIGDGTIAENRDDCSFIWENFYDEESSVNEYDLTLFIQGEDGKYERFCETHYQRGYEPEDVRKILEETGFRIIDFSDSETEGKVTGDTERVFVTAACIKDIR